MKQILLFALILWGANLSAQATVVPLKKRAADAAKKYVTSQFTGAGIVIDEFELLKLDTLTELSNADIEVTRLQNSVPGVIEESKKHKETIRLLQEKVELRKSVYGEGDVMTKMAISELEKATANAADFALQIRATSQKLDSLSTRFQANSFDNKKMLGYISRVRVVLINSASGAVFQDVVLAIRMNKNLRIIE